MASLSNFVSPSVTEEIEDNLFLKSRDFLPGKTGRQFHTTGFPAKCIVHAGAVDAEVINQVLYRGGMIALFPKHFLCFFFYNVFVELFGTRHSK